MPRKNSVPLMIQETVPGWFVRLRFINYHESRQIRKIKKNQRVAFDELANESWVSILTVMIQQMTLIKIIIKAVEGLGTI